MKKLLICFTSVLAGLMIINGCTKPNIVSSGVSAFADSLAKNCTQAFVGPGDSGNYCLPTAFTPNGDGINDFYLIQGGGNGTFSSFNISIYRTTGALVYQMNSPATKWNGRNASDSLLSDYKYYVTVKYTTTGNKTVNAWTYLYLLSTNTTKLCVNDVIADTANYKFPDEYNYLTGTYGRTTMDIFCN